MANLPPAPPYSPQDQNLITDSLAEIAATADQYPGVVIVLGNHATQVEYMSGRGLRMLGATIDELRAMGPAYYERYFNSEEAHEYVPKIVDLLERNDPAYVVSFFQQVRTGTNQTFEWYLSAARVLVQGSAGQPLLTICLSCPIDPESHVTAKVQRLLDENSFLRNNHGTFALLTPREREVLQHLALGRSSLEIAEQLYISVQTAETHRRNIRSKLNVASAFELGQYARAFNLI